MRMNRAPWRRARRAAVMNSAPSSEPSEWSSLGTGEHGPSYVAHLGVQVMPELSVGASYDRGGYLIGLVSAMDVVRWIGAGFGIATGT